MTLTSSQISLGMRLFVLAAWCSCTTSAFAADEGKGEAGSIMLAFKWVVGRLLSESILDTFVGAAKGMAQSLVTPAAVLAGSLALISLIWGVLMAFVNKKPPLNTVVEVGIFAALSGLMIQNFAWVSDGVYQLAKEAMSAMGTTTGKTTLPGKAAEFLESLLIGFGAIISAIVERWETIKLIDLLDLIPSFIAVAIAMVFGLLAFVTLLGLALQGPFALGIGLAISPLIAATIASPYTRRWFDQWLNFMVGAAFSSAMIFIALGLLMAPMANMIADVSTGEQTKLAGAAIQIAILMFFASKMLAAVPNISDAIFPGRTGAGSIASSARDLAAAASKVAAVGVITAPLAKAATAALKGSAGTAQASMNGMSNFKRAMSGGLETARSDTRSSGVEKVGAAAMMGGESMVNDVAGRVSSTTGRAADAVSKGWQTDKFKGVKLGDRVANALKTASGEVKNADLGVGNVMAAGAQVAGGVAMATAGAATKLAGGALDAAGQGVAAGYRTVTRSSAERRKSVREQMMGTSSPTPPPTNSGD